MWNRFALAALSLALALPAAAEDKPYRVSLVGDAFDGTSWHTGVRVELAPGWKTYWRAPGEAGVPPAFHWDGSENVSSAALHWPVPHVFHQSGYRSIGYADEVVIPVELTSAAPGRPARVAGMVEIGVCHDICVPVTLSFAADLPTDGGHRDAAIVAALVDRPMTAAEAGLAAIGCDIAEHGGVMHLTARMELPRTGGDEVVVFESPDPGLWISEAEVRREGGVLHARAELAATAGQPVALDRSALRITVLGDGRAVDIRGCPAG